MQTRPFGRTGEQLPVLGLGSQRLVDTENCSEAQAVALLNAALDRGIRYIDTAWVYALGQSEQRVGLVARDRRREMWIATKTMERTRDAALRNLEESLVRLQTDHVDEWRLHHVATLAELDACFAPQGALQALIEAQEQGLVRHLSISGHTDPRVQIEALRRFPFASVLFVASALDHFIYSFAEELLPPANAQGVAAIATKVLAGGKLRHLQAPALRYALSLPVSIVLVGCRTLAELEQDLQVAETWTPLDGPERLEFFRQILPLVTPQNLPWKAAEWGRGEWMSR